MAYLYGESMVNLRPGAGCLSRELAPGAGCEPRGKGLQFGSTNTKENMKGILCEAISIFNGLV